MNAAIDHLTDSSFDRAVAEGITAAAAGVVGPDQLVEALDGIAAPEPNAAGETP